MKTDYAEGANPTPVNETLFSEIPPPLCKKKGGATFRIKCTDDGYPQDAKPSAEIAQHEIETKTSRHSDISRAKTKVPRQSYRGKNFGHMSEKLNAVLLRDSLINTRKCSDWPAEEIQALQARLFLLRDGIFQNIYHGAQDNRRLRGDLNKLQTRCVFVCEPT